MKNEDRYQVLIDNPSPRLPVCMLIDRSYSMRVVTGGTRTGETVAMDGRVFHLVQGGKDPLIGQLLTGFRAFVQDILGDIRAKASVELAVISFSDTITIERDFGPVDARLNDLDIDAMGDGTRLGLAVKTALQLLDRRKDEYNDEGISYYQPQLIILTDGAATDSDLCAEQGRDVQSRMNDRKLISLPFLIGREPAGDSLQRFGPDGEWLRIGGVSLVSLFRYLSQSSIQASRSTAGADDGMSAKQMIEQLRSGIISADEV